MERAISTILVAAASLLAAAAARAQGVPDNLQCYKVRDPELRALRGVVDLDAPSIGVAPGCKIGKAKLYCAPARQSVRPGTLFNGNTPVTEVPYHGAPAASDRICYRVTCPKPSGTAAAQTATDRFGTRRLGDLKTDMVCTPAVGGTLPPPAQGFQIKSPEIEIDPGQNVPYCYYFRTPNDVPLAVKRFTSSMRDVNRQLIVFTTTTQAGLPVDIAPPGTVQVIDCNVLGTFNAIPHWLYETTDKNGELAMPDDDGAGNPLAMEIAPNSSGFLLMHHHNTTAVPQKGQVTVNFEALDSPVYTRTETFMATNSLINVPPHTTDDIESRSCDVPAGAKFWSLTTHTHKYAKRSSVQENTDVIFATTDWTNPGATTWPTPPFFGFATNRMTTTCTYDNPNGFTVRTGGSYQSEEQCVAVGYFFPATKPLQCRDGFPL
jgi:hypothetical protein